MEITTTTSTNSTSKVIGGGLIIAGTSIGAGMLSIPLMSAGLGFGVSVLLLFGFWALMTYTSMLMLEVHQHADSSATLHTLSTKFLGNPGKVAATIATFMLLYALCAAYVAGGGSNMATRLDQLTGIQIPAWMSSLIFVTIVAALVAAGTAVVDKVNRVLFGAMMVAMAAVLVFLSPNISGTLLAASPKGWGLFFAALPVIFTSFGFHGSIPSIVTYFDGETKSLRTAMLIGSCIPLVVYLFWLACTLGVVQQDVLMENGELGAMIAILGETLGSSNIAVMIGLFADLALVTSFLGVSLGLFDYLRDTTKDKLKGNRVSVALITFLPPLAFALFYPQGFIMALGYAAIALVVIAIFLPVAMTIASRKVHKEAHLYRVKGGPIAMAAATLCGVVIILAQFIA
ncbi:aromatic amino acid transport family protein [Vibrio rhodolitus]|uniref:aromatic amino acid transport family protein n=1 Tax=Vibrio rhodolitus TaxID=2231649 RepID=UPI000E0A5E19|nr:aromatic amino acid transport family protein [Vibrio rhodolitus]